MTTLTGSMATLAVLWLLAPPALAADGCMAPAPKLEQMAQRAELDDVTRGKVDSLLHDAAGLCDEGDVEQAKTKFANVRQLLDSDLPGQVAPKVAPEAAPHPTPELAPGLKRSDSAQ